MVVEILLGIIAASTVILVILFSIFLIRLKSLREKTLGVLEEIEEEIRPVSYELRELMDNINELTQDIKQKLDDVDGLFKLVGSVGSHRTSCESRVESIGCKIAEVMECLSCGISLFNKMRK